MTQHSNIRVSAIITTHNRLGLLKRAVDSVRNQTYPNIELIVVDDGSNDGTEQWCITQDFQYIRISPEESRGGNYARNLGIKIAKGEYVAFLDDDDAWFPTKTEKQINIARRTGAKMIHGGRTIEQINADGTVEYIEQIPTKKYRGDLSRISLISIFFTTSVLLVERKLLLEIGMFDESISFWQDSELGIRLTQKTNVEFVSEPVFLYRNASSDPNRLTNKYYKWRDAVMAIRSKHKNLFDTLTFEERSRMKLLDYREASDRAMRAGMNFKSYVFNIKAKLCLPVIAFFKLIDVIKN